MRERLTATQVARLARPSVDRQGLVFEYGGELHRCLRGEAAEAAARLLDDPIDHLIPFERASVDVEGYELTLKVSRIERVTYPPEWPTVLLRAAALATLRAKRELLRRGLSLQDAHPWNVLFEGCEPRLVDLGSLRVGARVDRAWLREFRRHFLVPLTARRLGLHAAADALQAEHNGPLKRMLDRRPLTWFPVIGNPKGTAILDRLERAVLKMPTRGRDTGWSGYEQGGATLGDASTYAPKQTSVAEFLSRFPPSASVLDLAANRGWFSRLAARRGHEVMAIDIDDPALGMLVLGLDEAERRRISPARIDVVRPPAPHGVALMYDDPYGRMRSDVVLAIAILHHLVGHQGVTFELFAALMDRLAGEAAIVEFVPAEDVHVATWPVARQPWYREDRFVEAMAPYFRLEAATASSPDPRRMLLFVRHQDGDTRE